MLKHMRALSGIVILLALGLVYVCVQWSHMLRWPDYLFILALFAMPIPAIASLLFADKEIFGKEVYLYINPVPNKKPPATRRLFPYILLWLLLISFAMIMNVGLDNSTPTEVTATITKKYITKTRHSTIFYGLDVVSPVPAPLPVTFKNTEHFSESEDSYRLNVNGQKFDAIVPDHSEVVMKLHKGYFGIPWYEGSYKIRKLAKPKKS